MTHFLSRAALLVSFVFGPMAGFAQVTLTATSGTTTGSFTTLKGAFDAINAGTHKGTIVIKINSSTSEGTSSASLTASAATSSSSPYYTSINIYPTTTGLSISGSPAAPLINLNGADNVTIDGRVNATGSTKSLTISNTSALSTTGTSTIRFIADASSNTVQYCTLKGSSTDAAAGIIFFSTATTTGNDNNTITNNDITCAADGSRPLNAVYAFGTSTKNNDNNSISNNNIYNFLSKSTASQGINIGSYNSGYTISGNSFYETASFAATAAVNYNVILISAATGTGNGFTVSGNYIGGKEASCGGTAWTKTDQNTAFTAISVTTATGTANSIQGNTIQNFNWTNAGTSDFTGIYLSGATVANIGTVTGNTIGAASGTASITFTSNTTATDFYGINIASTDVVDCRNNTIGAITAANASTSATNFYGIVKSVTAGTTTISSNTIGSTSSASSINASSASSTAANIQSVYGIQSIGTGTVTISGNTIANMVNATTNATTTAAGLISGIYVSAGTNTISNNTVRNLSIANANNNLLSTPSVSGIVMISTTAAAQTVSGNTVHSLSNSNTGFTGGVIGIYYNGPTTASTVSRNFIHSLSVSSSSTTADLYGIKINAGATTYSNNIISLGGNTTTDLFGIFETGAASNNNSLFYNTVYISGSLASGANNVSYALYSAVNTNTRDFRNNVLVNARSTTSGTDRHFALYIVSSGGTITCNYNNYFVSGTGGVLGYFAANKTSLPIVTSNDANSIATNPTFSNAGGTTAADYTPTVRGTGVTGTGITVDYDNNTRGMSVSMGAFEVILPPSITSFSPISAKPGDAVTLTGIRFNTTAANNIVFFGGTRATVTASTANSVTVTVPIGATYAPITLLNTGTVLAAASLSNFNPIYSPAKASITSADISAKVDFTTGTSPTSVAIGDLDGDGKPDLAVANTNSHTVSVFRNTSVVETINSGSFSAKVDFSTGYRPQSVAIGDLDGDGKPELVLTNGSSATVSVLRNTSTSGSIDANSFATKVDFTTESNPLRVAIGDLDGDGKPDLAVANGNSFSISVLRNKSTSGTIDATSFATRVNFTTGSYPQDVAIGDLDGDGKPELVCPNRTSPPATVSVFRNTSTSGTIDANSFATKVDFTTASHPIAVAIGDLDADGKLDLVVVNNFNGSGGSVSVFRNTSTSGTIASGSFATKVDFTTGTSPYFVAIGDLDGDEKPDLTVTNSGSNTISVFRNTSTSGTIAESSFSAKVDFTTGSGPWSVAFGDLDGDSKPDLAVTNTVSHTVSVLRNACTKPSSGGTITGAQNGPSGFDPEPFASSAAASGHTGTLEYKWQSSTTSSSAGFSDISGATSATYDPGTLTQTTWYKRLARVTCNPDWTGAAESNVLEMTVVLMYSEPSAQPTGLYFSSTGTSTYNLVGRFTASGSATGYLVVRSTGSAPTFTPTDGTAYTTGSQTGGEIVYSGSLTSFTDLAVTNNLAYHYAIYAYNGTGTATNYRTTSPLIGVAFARSGSTGSLSSSSTASTLSFPSAGATVNFPAGTNGTSLTVSRTASAPSSNIQVNSSIRGKKPMYFSITSTTRSPGTYTLVVDFSGLGPLTNAQWNSYKITKRKNNKSPWVDVTKMGATIVSRNTDGVMGKFTIRGLSSFSEFGLDEEYDGVLVSNLDQTPEASPMTVTTGDYAGQAFVTDGIRYDLSKLKVSISANEADLGAYLYGSTPDGRLDSSNFLTVFYSPTLVSGNLYELTPLDSRKLEPNTQYWVLFFSYNAPVYIDITSSGTETGPASFPGNYSVSSSDGGSSYNTPNTDPPALFSIEATEVTRTWTGVNSSVWSDPDNWMPAETPGNGEILTIPNESNDPVLDGNISPANLIIESGTILNMADKNITLTQGFSNDGSLISTTGRLILAGTSAQGIVGTGSISNLEVNNSAGVLISGDDFMQSITGTLTPTAGILSTNGNLTLKSSSAGTARVASGSASGGYIDGEVTVERYIPSGRKWRFLTAPLTGSSNNSIFYNWQNNDVPNGSTGVEIWGPGGHADPSDANTGLAVGPNPSMRSYGSSGWQGVTNTNTTLLFDGTTNYGFALFQTGPYNNGSTSYIGSLGNLPTAVATTLSATGTLITGDHTKSFTATAANQYFLVGNPYASPVDPRSFASNRTNLNSKLWMWDAKPGNGVGRGLGSYVSFDLSSNTYSVTGNGFADNNVMIQSGQAFFVQSTASGAATLVFRESSKNANGSHAMMGNTTEKPKSLLRLTLQQPITGDSTENLDGAVAVFHAEGKPGLDPLDGSKLMNSSENIFFRREERSLTFEHRPMVTATDTLQLRMSNLQARSYRLQAEGADFTDTDGVSAELIDRFTGRSVPLSLTGKTDHPFTVTADSLSTGDRFLVVFRRAAAPVVVTPDRDGNSAGLKLYPNPVRDDLQVSVNVSMTGPYTVQVVSGSGEPVWMRTGIVSGTKRVEINTSGMVSGVYHLVLTDAQGGKMVKKFVKE